MLGAVAWCSTTSACWSFVYRPRKRELGWPEPIVLLSRGRLLNSRDPDRGRAPDPRQKPGSGPSDPSNGSNGRRRGPAWFVLFIGPNGPLQRSAVLYRARSPAQGV